MRNEILNNIIKQIRKYNLIDFFKDVDVFKDWASTLNETQINNFLSLNFDLEMIGEIREITINKDLLSCRDYVNRIQAVSKLKNIGEWGRYITNVCNPTFLKSKHFYNDIDLLSQAITARYGLELFANDDFVNSPYHVEDLEMVVATYYNKKDLRNIIDFTVTEALVKVAGNKASINSPYHREDMRLISKGNSEYLQTIYSSPKTSFNCLAIDEVSLQDKYHIENMNVLAENPMAKEFLYKLMTNPKIVEGKNYRKEIEALLNAKSRHTARALYYYIYRPEKMFTYDRDFYLDYDKDIEDSFITYSRYDQYKSDPDYVKNFERINKTDDIFVMHYVSLLMNPYFLKSQYREFDLELLAQIKDKPTYMNLYDLMTSVVSLEGKHHKKDAALISQTQSRSIRNLLLEKATNDLSLQKEDHEYDMKYLFKLDLDTINEKTNFEIMYYMFNPKGLEDINRKTNLEKLAEGKMVEPTSNLSIYLDYVEKRLECEKVATELIPTVKGKPKILGMFKKRH